MLLPSEETADHSAAVSYNVLEHIEDHVGALRTHAARWSARAATSIIVVPAFMFAMSPVDIATGHVRRYTRKTMRAALTEAGLEIERLHYANSLGLIGYYVSTSLLQADAGPGPMVKVYDSARAAGDAVRGADRAAAVRPVGVRDRAAPCASGYRRPLFESIKEVHARETDKFRRVLP